MASLLLQPPLVGRERETGFLQDRMRDALSGRGSVVFIAGEAGIGKSRLAHEFEKRAAEEGIHFMHGRCIPGAPTPYLPFEDALEQYFQSESRGGISKKLAKFPKEAGLWRWLKGPEYREFDLEPETERERTLHATLELLKKISAKTPILIELDDLQWADSASIQLLHFLARKSGELRVVILGTYRPEDLDAPGNGAVHPLVESLRIMRREGICHELSLNPLKIEDLKLALQGMLGGLVDAELLQRICSESDGNPLYAVEAIRLLVQTGAVTLETGVWRAARAKSSIDIPRTVKEVIILRLERLSKDERRILESAAVSGESFDPDVLAEALDIKKLNLLETLDSLVRGRQLLISEGQAYRFSHEKIRQVTYEEVSSPRRKELHRLIGQALERRLPDNNLYPELSLHFCNADAPANCAKYSLAAGQASLRAASFREAATFFQRAVQSAQENPSLQEERLQGSEGLGDTYFETRSFDLARSEFQSVLNLCNSPTMRARVLRKYAGCFLLPSASGNPAKARELLNEALRQYPAIDAIELGKIKSSRAFVALFTGNLNEAESYFSEAEQAFELAGAKRDLAQLLLDRCYLDLAAGHPQNALEKAKRARDLFVSLQGPWGELHSTYRLGLAYFYVGMVEEALATYERGREIADGLGYDSLSAAARFWKAIVYYAFDDFDSMCAEVVESYEFAFKTESVSARALATACLAYCEGMRGKTEEAEKLMNEALEVFGFTVSTDVGAIFSTAIVHLLQAEILRIKKNWAESTKKFKQCIAIFQKNPIGLFPEVIGRTRFGQALAEQGMKLEAKEQFDLAIRIYERLGNKSQVQRAMRLTEVLDQT